jgi:hypothetical protein
MNKNIFLNIILPSYGCESISPAGYYPNISVPKGEENPRMCMRTSHNEARHENRENQRVEWMKSRAAVNYQRSFVGTT